VQQRKTNLDARNVLKDLSQCKGADWPEAICHRWISLEYLFGRNDEVRGASLSLPSRRELKKKGGGRPVLQQVIHMLTSKPKRSLFRPIFKRRWK